MTAARFVESVKRCKLKLVGLSALLTTTMPVMRDTVKAIRDEGFKAQFTAEAFNLASHPNFKNVSTGHGSANLGQITSARDPRVLEFALKLFLLKSQQSLRRGMRDLRIVCRLPVEREVRLGQDLNTVKFSCGQPDPMQGTRTSTAHTGCTNNLGMDRHSPGKLFNCNRKANVQRGKR